MKVLLTSEEGYTSPGVAALRQALMGADLDVVTVAPGALRSNNAPGSSRRGPPETIEPAGGDLANPIFRVDGSPLECVRVAIGLGLVDQGSIVVAGARPRETFLETAGPAPDLEGAVEGALLGYPSLAISRESPGVRQRIALGDDDFRWCGTVAAELVAWMFASPLPVRSILNVNVPSVVRDRHLKLVGISTALWTDADGGPIVATPIRHAHGSDGGPSIFTPGAERQAVANGHVAISQLRLGPVDADGDEARLCTWARQMVTALDPRLGTTDGSCLAGCCG